MDADAPAPVHLDKVMDGLATNPAVPANLIGRLVAWRRGHGTVARRPDLTEDMCARIIATGDHRLLHGLALNDRLPGRFRVLLAAHRDEAVRSALVVHAATAPRAMLERLIDDPAPQVRRGLAQAHGTPPDLRARLATDPVPEVRAALARHWTQAAEVVRRALLTDPEAEVRAAACSTSCARGPRPAPPADLLPTLLADPVTRAGAVAHAVLDADTLRRLAADPDASVRVQVFARQDTPEHVRAEIHDALHGLSCPGDVPGPDADDDEAFLRWYDDVAARGELRTLRLPWVTADPLPHLDSPYVAFRVSAALGEALPAHAVARLLDDEEEIVRLTMASAAPHLVDPATAESIERRYRRRDKFTFWWDEAQVLTFPPDTLRRFAADPEPRLRSFAPRDPDLPPELAEKLASDPEDRVRRAVAPHRNLPLPSLLRLLADPSGRVAEAAGASPSLPVGRMEWLLTRAGL
ncbi:hypothetical protein [Streptomyces avicenniae]|uniref:hypothetical protein n=1 Tax=Streptomyces avicenniae TaxID=500153 RepID=UPI00069BCAF4|nr:hypothetical protein [Streptomyces avicenniae]